MPNEKSLAQQMHENVVALREQGAPKSVLDEEIAYWGQLMREKGQGEDRADRTKAEKVGTAAQGFADSATLGLTGVADDALTALFSDDTFGSLRRARKENRNALLETNPALAIGADVAGSLSTAPLAVGTLLKAGQGAGKIVRAATAVGDAALQSGITGATTSLEGTTRADIGAALEQGKRSAVTGAGVSAGLGGLLGAGTKAIQRARGIEPLDRAANTLAKKISATSGTAYAKALAQPPKPLSRDMRNILNHKDVLPVVKRLRGFDQWQGVKRSDPRFLDAVYKEGLSDWGEGVKKTIAADPAKANTPQALKKHIDGLKSRFLSAMDTQVPGYRDAVQGHAVMKSEEAAFERGADVAKDVGTGKSMPAKKWKSKGEAKFLDSIDKMTVPEAELALAGVMGRKLEAVHMTSSPLGIFGTLASAVRVPLQTFRTRRVVEKLEQKIGRKYSDRRVSEGVRGASARLLGSQNEGRRGLLGNY